MRRVPSFPIQMFLVAVAMFAATSDAQQAPPLAASGLGGLRLRNIGPANMSGRFVDMDVVESDPHTMGVASATGGCFRTRDNGITWEPVFEREPVHSMGDIAIFQPNPNIIWIGTGERANRQSVSWGDGVYKTTDAGKTWTNVGLQDSMHIGRIVTSPANPAWCTWPRRDRCGGRRRARRVQHDGWRQTWQRTLHVDEDTGATDVAIDSSDPSVLYAATYQRRRTAFRLQWRRAGQRVVEEHRRRRDLDEARRQRLPDGEMGRIGIAIFRKDPRIVYVSIEQGFRYNASTAYTERRAGLYRSNDDGKTWRLMSDWNPRPMYASQPTIDPQDDRRVYMMNSYSFSTTAARRSHAAARRRTATIASLDQPARLAPRDQAGRWRYRHLASTAG